MSKLSLFTRLLFFVNLFFVYCSQSQSNKQKTFELIHLLEENHHFEVFTGMVVDRRGDVQDGLYRASFLYTEGEEHLQFYYPSYSIKRDSVVQMLNDSLSIFFAAHFKVDRVNAQSYVKNRAKQIGLLFNQMNIYEVNGALWFGNSVEYKITPKFSLYYVPDDVVYKRGRKKIIEECNKLNNNWYYIER